MMHISPMTRVRPLPVGYRPDRVTVRPVSDGPRGDRTGDDAGTYDRPPERAWADAARRTDGLARHVNTLA